MTAPDIFFDCYVIAALWSSSDDDGKPLDARFDETDIAPDTLAAMRADCDAFYDANTALMTETGASDEQHGHDFWLTRCGHGAGFWDRGYGPAGDKLSDAARTFGNVDLYVGDDGKIYA